MKGLAARMRKAGRRLQEFGPGELADASDCRTYKERKQAKNTIRDFMRRGEMERIARGRYRYVEQKRKRTLTDVIWHLVRSHRRFTTDEIERLSGAARATVREYLACLVGYGYLRRQGWQRWQMINDPGPDTPVNWAKCARLKRVRREKKEGRRQAADAVGTRHKAQG